MKHFLKFSSLCILLVILGGCVVKSINPLAAPDKSVIDERILGVWLGDEGTNVLYLHIGKLKDGTAQAYLLEHNGKGEVDFDTYNIFTTTIEDKHYLNVRGIDEKDLSKMDQEYVFVKYVISPDETLQLFLMKTEKVIEAIESGKLAGTVSKEKYARGATITDTSENIVRFFHTIPDDQLFGDPVKLKRVKQP